MESDPNRTATVPALGALERRTRSDIRLPASIARRIRLEERRCGHAPVPANTRAIVRTAGGGGWGSPLEREPEKVRMDILEGFVSRDAARKEYGVVMKPGLEVDVEATRDLRAKMKKEG